MFILCNLTSLACSSVIAFWLTRPCLVNSVRDWDADKNNTISHTNYNPKNNSVEHRQFWYKIYFIWLKDCLKQAVLVQNLFYLIKRLFKKNIHQVSFYIMQVPFHIVTFLPFTYVLPSISSTFPQKGSPPWSPYITQTLASLSPKMLPISFLFCLLYSIRELKQQRRWRLQKFHLTSEFALLQTLSRLFQLFHCVKCWQISLELNLKDCIKVQEKKKKVVVLHSLPRQNMK